MAKIMALNATLDLKNRPVIAFAVGVCLLVLSGGATNITAGEAVPSSDIVSIQSTQGKRPEGVLRWNAPVLVGYADGSVIWRLNWERCESAFRTTSSMKAKDLTTRLARLVQRYNGREFVLTQASEGDSTIVASSAGQFVIRGSWERPRTFMAEEVPPGEVENANRRERECWRSLPIDIRDALTAAKGFEDPEAKPWSVEKVRMILQPPNSAIEAAFDWPVKWPSNFIPWTREGSMLMIDFPGEMLSELLQSLPDDGTAKAVHVRGEKRYVTLHLILPDPKVERPKKK